MVVSVQTQLFVFISGVVSGGVLGAMFDLFRILRRRFHARKVLIASLDIVFWILSAFFVLRVMLVTNDGVVRAFELVGVLLGGWLYLKYLSKFFSNVFLLLVRFFHKVATIIITIAIFPVLLIIRIFRRPYIFVMCKARVQRHRFVKFARRI